jgi:hypothetical protein
MQHKEALYKYLEVLGREHTSTHILYLLERHLTELLLINPDNKFTPSPTSSTKLKDILGDALHHQTIIGWENALRGFTSQYWFKAQLTDQSKVDDKRRAPWNIMFMRSLINLHKQIWDDRNTVVHGKTLQEQHQKLRHHITDKVRAIYSKNYKLAPRFPAINAIPLEIRLRRTTQNLQEWISRVEHMKSFTDYLTARRSDQITILEAFSRVKLSKESKSKYPP